MTETAGHPQTETYRSTQSQIDFRGSSRAWLNWGLGVAFVVVVFIMQSGYAITNKSVAADLGLSLTQVGLVGSVYTWVFAIAQFGSGSMLDRLGARRCLPLAAALLTVGAVVFALATSYWMLIAGQVLMALGGSFGFIGAGFIGGQWFDPLKYGFMFSLVQFAASTGALVGQRSISFLIENLGLTWPVLIGGIAVLGALVTVLMLLVLRDPPGAEENREGWQGLRSFIDSILTAVSTVASVRAGWLNALIAGATFGSLFAMGVVWGPRLMMAAGMPDGQAYSVGSLCWLGLATGAPCISWLSDRVGKLVKPMAVACALQLVFLGAALIWAPVSPVLASVLLFAFGFCAGGSMLPFAIAAKLVPGKLVGTSAALVNAVQFIISGMLMALPGQILAGASNVVPAQNIVAEPTYGDYQVAMLVFPGALLLALILSFFLHEPYSEADRAHLEVEANEIAAMIEKRKAG